MAGKTLMGVVFAALVAALLGLATVGAGGVKEVGTAYAMPVQAKVSAKADGCSNAPGPVITLWGELTLGGMGVNLIFRNNEKGTHTRTEEAAASVVVVPAGETIVVPKQPVDGGVGGNPHIYLQFLDGMGSHLSGELYLGRCVQGLDDAIADFAVPAAAAARISADDCTNSGGPYITVSGELRLSGINVRLILRNANNPVGGPHEADASTTVDVAVLPAGGVLQFPKQPVLGGVGGNPIIYIRFLDGSGNPVGGEIRLGRCTQL